MPTYAVNISGVAVKLRQCSCGWTVFDADCYGVGERATFDVLPAEAMEMIAGNDAVYYRPRMTPSFQRHICAIDG